MSLRPSQRPLELAVRYLLGGLLLWAAVSKLANPTVFLGSLYAYELPLPAGFLKAVAVVLPWTELLCGLMLLANTWPQTTLLVVAGLFGVFVLATAQAATRGLEISCGCFDLKLLGFSEAAAGTVRFIESPAFALVRNLGLLGAAVWLLKSGPPGGVQVGASSQRMLDTARGSASVSPSPALKRTHKRKHR